MSPAASEVHVAFTAQGGEVGWAHQESQGA